MAECETFLRAESSLTAQSSRWARKRFKRSRIAVAKDRCSRWDRARPVARRPSGGVAPGAGVRCLLALSSMIANSGDAFRGTFVVGREAHTDMAIIEDRLAPEAFSIWFRDCTIRQSPRCETGMCPLGTIWGAGRPLNRRRCSNRRARIAELVRRGSTETMPTVPPATGAIVVKRMFDTSVPLPGTCQESRIFVLQRTTRQMLSAASPATRERSGKQKTPRKASANSLIFLRLSGAGEGIRTLDPNLGKRLIIQFQYLERVQYWRP